MPMVEGLIERFKSWLASRDTGDGLTGTHGGRLNRTNRCPNDHERAVHVQAWWKPLDGGRPCARSRCLRSLLKSIAFDFLLLYGF